MKVPPQDPSQVSQFHEPSSDQVVSARVMVRNEKLTRNETKDQEEGTLSFHLLSLAHLCVDAYSVYFSFDFPKLKRKNL